MVYFGGVAMVVVPTLGVGLPQSLHMASRGFYWLYLSFGVATVGFATLGVYFSTSYQMSRISCALNLASFCGVTMTSVATLATRRFPSIVPYRFPRHLFAWVGVVIWRREEKRHDARRQFSSVLPCDTPGLMFAKMVS
jgi:hypothetical protein